MSHLRPPLDDTERLLTEALQARTERIFGRPESLAELRRASNKDACRASRFPRSLRLSPAFGIAVIAAVVLLIVVGINFAARQTYRPGQPPAAPSHTPAHLKQTGYGYSPADYFPAVNAAGMPVIVRVSDGEQMRILPRGRVSTNRWAPISPMVLSPDGNRVYGVGRNLQDNGQHYPAGYGTEHVVSIDLKTNQFSSLATRDGLIHGFTLSADGTTFAYSLQGGQDGQADRDVIYVHDLGQDTDRHFPLAAGQRTIEMALSPDGSELAINAKSDSAAVAIMSTASDDSPPTQELLGRAGCSNPVFGPLQWTVSGLYAVRSCISASSERIETIVRVIPHPYPDRPAAVFATLGPGVSEILLVRDTPTGVVLYDHQMGLTEYGATKIATSGATPVTLPDIRLSGPGT